MQGYFKKSLKSFNRFAKDSGLAPILELSNEEEDRAEAFIRQLKRCKDFWHWDQDYHRSVIQQYGGGHDCPCFNHTVKLPRDKLGNPRPIHNFQKLWFDALQSNKYLLLRKPVGAGATTFFLRWSIWMATRNDDLRGKEVGIVVGPNELLGQGLIQRIRQVFLANDVILGGSKTELTINDCLFRAYPSNHLDSLRSRTDLKIIIVDELDFLVKDRGILRECVERYITKTDPWIIADSTPGPINSLMYEMEHEQPSIYTKIAQTWEDCKEMYSASDVAIARQSPSWNREMMAAYGSTLGNVFSSHSIRSAVELGKTVDLNTIITSAPKVLAIDPGTTTGVCLCQFANNRCEVLIAEEWERVDISDILERIMGIVTKYENCKIFCDAAMPLLWSALARQFNEGPDYLEKVKDMINDGRPQHQIINRFTVHALNFGTTHKQMLQLAKALLDDPDGLVAIHPSQEMLIQALSGAMASEWVLDKNESPFNHLLDSFRMACTFFRYEYQLEEEQREQRQRQQQLEA